MDAALIVSGARDGTELDRLRRRFADATAPVLKRLPRVPGPAERAAALLLALHRSRSTETPLLRDYVTDATTLIDVIETGRYNCVSATIAFLLLAEAAKIEAGAVLLPSHARAVVRAGDRRFPVETTSAYGFDPGEAELREVQRRFQPGGSAVLLYSDAQGTDVEFLALLGAIYTNVSTMRAVRGDAAGAQALADRAAPFIAPAARPALSRIRVGLLNELAIGKIRAKSHEEALAALQEAMRLKGDDEVQRLVTNNLTAVAHDRLAEIAPASDEATILGFPERFAEWPPVRNEVRAFALRLVARRRAEAGQWERAVRELREAGTLTQITEHREVIARELVESELRRIDALAEADLEAAWRGYLVLDVVGDDEHLRNVRRAVEHRLVVRRVKGLAEQERCEELDQPLAMWRELDPEARPDAVRASCHANRGVRLWREGMLERAAEELRHANRVASDQPTIRHSLVGVLQALVAAMMRTGRCVDARPLIAEGRTLAADDAWVRSAEATCGSSRP